MASLRLNRRRLLHCLLSGAAAIALRPRARAEELSVPVSRQAELLVRVAAYDRNLPARAKGTTRVLILMNPDDADSRTVANQMESALRGFDKIAGLPSEITTMAYPGGAQVAAACRQNHIAIVYVTQGLDAKIPDLVNALTGVDVLSVAAVARYVTQSVVLGFDLVSAKPTLVINLPQAGRQSVSMDAGVLNLMKVIQ